MSDYKPGTVALVRVSADYPTPEVGIRGGNGKWYVAGPRLGSQHGWYEERIEIVRPLVVLDLKNEEPVCLVQNLRKRADDFEDDYTKHTVAFLRNIADQIEQQTKPPKPETKDAHDGCHDKGWTEVDGVRYCNNCGFSEGSRFIKAGGAR